MSMLQVSNRDKSQYPYHTIDHRVRADRNTIQDRIEFTAYKMESQGKNKNS